ncbi:MAG: hypothetical protein JSW34_04205 [Candidatus Zixiibacteriota bacterium]|nr:MAG: hypothetical protein JSW34_04205 [candidate division Zixibacteria bacterium]
MRLVVTNWAFWGFGGDKWDDFFTGETLYWGSEFPRGSLINQIQSAQTWIGGIKGKDTLVSIAISYDASDPEYELWQTWVSGHPMITRTNTLPGSPGYEEAVSNEDIIVKFTDTIVSHPSRLDFLRGTPHIPMGLEVTQKTYSWSHELAEDFVLFDVTVKNIGHEIVHKVYFGNMIRPSVGLLLPGSHAFAFTNNSFCGFLGRVPSAFGCGLIDTLNMMWGANSDGDPVNGEYIDEIVMDPESEQGWTKSATSVHGLLFLDYPGRKEEVQKQLSYNWWSPFDYAPLDFGPRHRENFRDFLTGGLGWPRGDASYYHVLSNGEIDYDMVYTYLIPPDDPVWLYPPREIAEMASSEGLPAAPNLLSIGPFDIPPGASIRLPYAFVCGENFHSDPDNINNLPHSVSQYYASVDFSNLLVNASMARRIYDNPGRDTNGDGYAGEFTICDGDTLYYTGDGVPDWKTCEPPASPIFWLKPVAGGLRVRWNGERSETGADAMSGILDFEGYRVYCGLDQRAASLALNASYDHENFDKYTWNGSQENSQFFILEMPFSLDSLRCLYGSGPDPCADSGFNPLLYTELSPYVRRGFNDSVFYFQRHDYNASFPGVNTPVAKIYPDEPDPSLYHPDSIPEAAYTNDGYLKYYEYEVIIDNLLPTIPHWVNVTAFDFGDATTGVRPLESALGVGAKSAYPLGTFETTAESRASVYVYPNPYRIDAGYRDEGFEGRTEDDRPDYRVRAIHFRNLPPRCSISIYSLDGDLVRRLEHDMDPSDPNSSHDTWNLITRNTQMVVSGLYYWVVEAEDGSTQMGKLVIIM